MAALYITANCPVNKTDLKQHLGLVILDSCVVAASATEHH